MENREAFQEEWLYGLDFEGRVWTSQNSEENHFYWNGEIWVLEDIPENIVDIDYERAVGYIFDGWKLLEIKAKNLYIANPELYETIDRGNLYEILYVYLIKDECSLAEINEFKKEIK